MAPRELMCCLVRQVEVGPPGKSLADKFVFGLINRRGAVVGVLEGMRNYPVISIL